MMKNNSKKSGDVTAFSKNWESRKESFYNHWTKGVPENQVQLAFRNHWSLFNSFMQHPRFNKGKRVLEVGCGRGSLSCYFSDAGFDCTLIDLSPKVIEIAEHIFDQNKLEGSFNVGDANALELEDGSFDIVFSIGLLEHFEEISIPLKEQVRILDKGGLFISYIVPKYSDNVQKEFDWINDVLKGYHKETASSPAKEEVFRSDYGSAKYLKVLNELPLTELKASGVYPLPMISHSIDFPFSLMPTESEKSIVAHFEKLLERRKQQTGEHPWLCEEGFGQAFLIWGYKS